MPTVDLHVHSSHSNKPYSWFLRSGGAAECYTAVDEVYTTARRRGMDLVTLADHDTIDGALELCARHPGDTFVSVEISARFPDDGCIVHVIAIDLTEAQHRELQVLRRSIYELAAYLHAQQIAHFWCHPLSQVNGRLTRAHLEQCFLMFKAIEVRNGTRDTAHERRLIEITDRFTPALLESWAHLYPRAPWHNRAARWARVGGSDDHGSLAIARAYTRYEGEATVAALTAALRSGATSPGGEAATGTTLAHNVYGVLAGYLHASGQTGLSSPPRPHAPDDHHHERGPDVAPDLLRSLIEVRTAPPKPGSLADNLIAGGHTTLMQEMMRSRAEPALAASWRRAIDGLVASGAEGRIGAAADSVPAILKAFLVELPYLLAHRYHARDRRGADGFAQELGGRASNRPPRVAIFTDTIDDVNGVALGLRHVHAEARRTGRDLRVVACGGVDALMVDGDGIVRVPSVYDHRLAEYPEMRWSVPHLPPVLRLLTEHDIDLVQCSTPGPLGLAALAAARITGTPVIGQFHTDVPEYALRLTGDPAAAAIAKLLVGWFYRAMDRVLVPSAWVAELVRGLGVDADRLTRVPRGIDLARFSPTHRTPEAFARWGLRGHPVLLYVGRLSREKSLDQLMAAFRALGVDAPEARLVLVGEGPMRAELERDLPPGCVMTGVVTGPELAALYASAHAFVYPSTTETFGNAVVEAQASGLPVIVPTRGATSELMVNGVTGFTVDDGDIDGLHLAMRRLVRDPELRARMGREAARHATRYDLSTAVADTLRCYDEILAGGAHDLERELVA